MKTETGKQTRWRKFFQFLPSLSTFLAATGLEISGYQNPRLGAMFLGASLLLLTIPAFSFLKRVRVRVFLLPVPGSETVLPGARPHAASSPKPSVAPLGPEEQIDQVVKESLRIGRLISVLPPAHISMLKALSSGPKQVPSNSEARKSLTELGLIRFIAPIVAGQWLCEATNERALAKALENRQARIQEEAARDLNLAERAFLHLFFDAEPLGRFAKYPKKLMPWSTYNAGESLISKFLVVRSQKSNSEETYKVEPSAVQLLEKVMSVPLARMEFKLDLSKVCGPNFGNRT